MLSFLVVVAAAAPLSVAAPGFKVVGIDAVVAEALQDRFATQLAASGEVKVTSSRDIEQVLGVERQKQLLGCAEESTSCIAELAGSLGADVLLSANIVKAGTLFTVNLRFVALKDGRALVTATERVADLDALQAWLDRQASSAARRLRVALAPPGDALTLTAARTEPSPGPWIALSSAAVVAGVGLGVFVWGKGDFAELQESTDLTRIEQLRKDGPLKQGLGVGLMVGGGVGIAASLAWALLRKDDPVSALLVASPEGAAVVLQGRFP